MTKNKNIVFVYDCPHYLHAAWAKSIGAEFVNYAGGYKGGLILSQLEALQTNIPPADIYIVESAKCMLPVICNIINICPHAKVFCINSDTLFYDFPRYNWIIRRTILSYLGFVDYFISTSKYVKELAKQYITIPHIIVYPYVNFKKFSKVKIDLNSLDIAYIGNICHFRGTDILLNAMKGEKMNIKLIGRMVEQIDLPSNVSYTGRVENPEKYLNGGNYINPSRHDSFGINVLEAMSAGLPPIVSENVGAKEILPDKCLIAKLTPEDIKKKFTDLNKKKKRKRKRKLGKMCQKIARGFTKKRSIESFKRGLRECGVEC
jgi:glycosyltransferase involved in cell wall biosynthesis